MRPKKSISLLLSFIESTPSIGKQLDPFHPQLAEFMAQAMEVYADRKL